MEQFVIAASGVGSVGASWLYMAEQKWLTDSVAFSVQFPGAVNSKFTTDMAFVKPSDMPYIPTYRVMDSDGVLVGKDKERPVDVSDEEILTWYKNMLIGVLKTAS